MQQNLMKKQEYSSDTFLFFEMSVMNGGISLLKNSKNSEEV